MDAYEKELRETFRAQLVTQAAYLTACVRFREARVNAAASGMLAVKYWAIIDEIHAEMYPKCLESLDVPSDLGGWTKP